MNRPERSLNNHFCGPGLDRAEEVRLSPEALRRAWGMARVVAVDDQGRMLGDERGPHRWRGAELGNDLLAQASFLGQNAEEHAWFTIPGELLEDAERLLDARWIGLRHAAANWSRFHSSLFAYAKALRLWQINATHCGACGSRTRFVRAGHCARCTDPGCGMQQFPRTDAAIIVLVADGERALLGRQRSWPPRRWSTLAGFVEPGESLEDAVRREVGEESGVTLDEVEYHSSQPWPFPGALMVGFMARAERTQIRVGDELEDARWFSAFDLVGAIAAGEVRLPPPISISRHLIETWLERYVDAGAMALVRAHS